MGRLVAIDVDSTTLDLLSTVALSESLALDVHPADGPLPWLDASDDDVEAVVIGGERDTLRLVRRCQTRLPRVPVLVVASAPWCQQLGESLRYNPLGARDVHCVAAEQQERVGAQLRDALAQHRRRARAARTFGALNRRLASTPRPAPVASSLLGRLLDLAPIGVLVVDAAGAVRDCNTRALQLLAPSAAAGETLWELWPPADHPALRELLAQLDGELAHEARRRFRRRGDGDSRDLEVTGGALSADAGGPGYLLVVEDVTRQQQLVDQLQAASRAKDEFIAMLSHELRNPLAPIRTAVELLRLRRGASIERECATIERHVSYMVHLVDDLLDVARITQGKLVLRLEPIELDGTVADALELTMPLIEQLGHHLEVDVARDLTVTGDRRRLVQIFSNLLSNAAKYTPRGGTITIRGARDGDHVVCSVVDSGRGIAPELLPHIFDLFVQERQSLDRTTGGLGIGLAIVRSLVTLHEGDITVHSQPGRGSEFTVRLPAAARSLAPPAATGGHRAAARTGGRHARILVVDDNVDGAELLAEVLAHDFTVEVAHDGPAALRTAARFVPELVLLDIGLPVMDGWEVARRLRELPGLASVRIIALTGYGHDADRSRSADAGLFGHLVKPVALDALRALIDRALAV